MSLVGKTIKDSKGNSLLVMDKLKVDATKDGAIIDKYLCCLPNGSVMVIFPSAILSVDLES